MKTKIAIVAILLLLVGAYAINAQQQQDEKKNPYYKQNENGKVTVTDAQWKKVLSPRCATTGAS